MQAEWRQHSERVRRLASGLQVSGTGARFPRAGDLADPIAVGVHPAALVEVGGVTSRVPPYIPRDIEPELHAALRQGGFVLLVGESAAGKTRAAFEAIQVICPSYSFAAPSSRDALVSLLDALEDIGDFVMWLDDLERFLGIDGLTIPLLHRILSRNFNAVVMATMRSHEYDRYRDRSEKESVGADRESWRECRAVLRQARVIHLERRWTAQEKSRARSHAADPRLAQALALSDRFGVAETLAAGPELAEAWRDAWAPGQHPRGAALVAAAVAARRAGYHRPLPASVLEGMHSVFLDERGGPELRPESLDDALRWASSPTFPNGANSLLIGSMELGFLAFDYLIDLPQASDMPEQSWMVLVESANGPDAFTLAENAVQAYRQDRWLYAYRRAAIAGYAPAEAILADLGEPFRSAPESLKRARRYLIETRSQFGPDHENTLVAEQSVVILSINNGDFSEALALAESMVARGETLLGPRHRTVLAAQFSAACCILKLGKIEEGIARLDAAVDKTEEALGINDSATASRRITAARMVARAGRLDSARERLAILLYDYSDYPAEHYITMLLSVAAKEIEPG
jgi:hypothetical protein